jgi:hypothetical protein
MPLCLTAANSSSLKVNVKETNVIASKENARAALRMFNDGEHRLLGERGDKARTFIQEFLTAAERKLPSAAAYKAEQSRRRCRQAGIY